MMIRLDQHVHRAVFGMTKKMTDKLPRESNVKQLLVDSMLCFLFDIPVTDNCPILVLKKMYKIEKILPVDSSCTHLISTEMKVI